MEQEIISIITRDPDYKDFMNEYTGRFFLEYRYKQLTFWLFHEVGGNLYITISPDSIENASNQLEDIRNFQWVAKNFFEELR